MTTKPWRFHHEAQRELTEAAAWYEREARLGADFLGAFRALYDQLRRLPASAPRLEIAGPGVRRACLRAYPYVVIYVETETEYWVTAVCHQRRHPRTWRSRLPP